MSIKEIEEKPFNNHNAQEIKNILEISQMGIKTMYEYFGNDTKIKYALQNVNGYRIHSNNDKRESPFGIASDIN